jgi:hypothetical protein
MVAAVILPSALAKYGATKSICLAATHLAGTCLITATATYFYLKDKVQIEVRHPVAKERTMQNDVISREFPGGFPKVCIMINLTVHYDVKDAFS